MQLSQERSSDDCDPKCKNANIHSFKSLFYIRSIAQSKCPLTIVMRKLL